MAAKKNPRRKAKTGKESGGGIVEVETVLEEESDDDLPDLAPKTDRDEEHDDIDDSALVDTAAKDDAAVAPSLTVKDAAVVDATPEASGKLLMSDGAGTSTGSQEPYNCFSTHKHQRC
jgi:hypothetical protein